MKWRYMQHCCHSLGELWLRKGEAEKALALAEECLGLAEPTLTRKNVVKGWRLIEGVASRLQDQGLKRIFLSARVPCRKSGRAWNA